MSDIDEIQKRAKEILDKRRFERFRVGLQVRYRLIGSAEKNTLLKNGGYALPGAFMAKAAETRDLNQVMTEDISIGGVRVTTPSPMPIGSELWVNIHVPGIPVPINAITTVMWTRAADAGAPHYNSGLRFETINQKDLENMEHFLALQGKTGA